MKRQPLSAQKGEIEFRKKLFKQQIEGESFLLDEYSSEEINDIIKDRMSKTYNQMMSFKSSGVNLSPYLEIGAERCQRSLVMENDIEAQGIALDISYDMLKSCDYYMNMFKKSKKPIRICCDANNLPIKSNSIPFIFCYEVLHHFPDPSPIINGLYRVLSPNGLFFFDEEPFKRVLHINLYKGLKPYSKEKQTKSKFRKILDALFEEPQCNEIEHGVIENENITLSSWKKALNIFDIKKITLNTSTFLTSDLFSHSFDIKYFLNYLLGGGIKGICQKVGAGENVPINNNQIHKLLICPSCLENDEEMIINYDNTNNNYLCSKCSRIFPVVNGIILLFSHRKLSELYPDFSTVCKNR